MAKQLASSGAGVEPSPFKVGWTSSCMHTHVRWVVGSAWAGRTRQVASTRRNGSQGPAAATLSKTRSCSGWLSRTQTPTYVGAYQSHPSSPPPPLATASDTAHGGRRATRRLVAIRACSPFSCRQSASLSPEQVRYIFVAIMGADDYVDAYSRLVKLKLKKAATGDGACPPRVLRPRGHLQQVLCATVPGYAVTARGARRATLRPLRRFLTVAPSRDRTQVRFAMHFALGDAFKTLQEASLHRAANTAKLLAQLIHRAAVPITVLKVGRYRTRATALLLSRALALTYTDTSPTPAPILRPKPTTSPAPSPPGGALARPLAAHRLLLASLLRRAPRRAVCGAASGDAHAARAVER